MKKDLHTIKHAKCYLRYLPILIAKFRKKSHRENKNEPPTLKESRILPNSDAYPTRNMANWGTKKNQRNEPFVEHDLRSRWRGALNTVSFAEFLREGSRECSEEFLPIANDTLIPMQYLLQKDQPPEHTSLTIGGIPCRRVRPVHVKVQNTLPQQSQNSSIRPSTHSD